jgi:hypothetical protein
LARNRKALEAIVRFAHEQKIPPCTVTPEEMFAINKSRKRPWGQIFTYDTFTIEYRVALGGVVERIMFPLVLKRSSEA